MACTLSQARDWNMSLKSKHSTLVPLFVGGTSGIGKHTAIQLASVIDRPIIYIVGRNKAAGSQVIQDLNAANFKGCYTFIPADVSRLSDVDAVCQQLRTREKALDLLFLSPGAIPFSKQGKKAPPVIK